MRSKFVVALILSVLFCVLCVVTERYDLLTAGLFLGMAIDPSILGELDADIGVAVRELQSTRTHSATRLAGNFDQDGRALGAAIANSMILASLPEQGMGAKLADRTPSSPASPEYPNPPAQLSPAATVAAAK